MIYAKKNRLVQWMFQLVQKRLIRGTFSKLYVKDMRLEKVGGLYIANHSSWWDSLVLSELDVQQKLEDLYVMADYEGIKKVPIFRYIGAYSIDKNDSAHVKASLRYTVELLQNGKKVFLFPQGEEKHLDFRPLEFQQGIGLILKRAPTVPVIPLAFYYTFRCEKKQEIWISIGEPVYIERTLKREQIVKKLEEMLTLQLNDLRQDVIGNNYTAYEQLL